MINIPLPDIIKKIKEKSELTDADIKRKIKEKMDQLSGLISEEGAAHIIANELGIQLVKLEGKLKIKNILAGMRNVEVAGKVIKKYELREFDTGERKGKVANLLLGDETGIIRIVLWNNQTDNFPKINEQDIVNIKSGYVRENNGRKEVHLNDNSRLMINPKGVTIGEVSTARPIGERKKLSDLTEKDNNVEVLATIVQLFEPRFFEVCPECGARVQAEGEGFICRAHGKVKPSYAYVLNAFLDDGSDSIRSVFWRQQAQQLLDMDDDKIQAFRVKPEKFEPLKTELLGHIVKVNGRINKNETFGRLELVADTVIMNPDPDEEIENLKKEADKAAEEAEPSEEVKKEAEKIEAEEEAEEEKTEEPNVKEEKPKKVKVEEKKEVAEERVEKIKEEKEEPEEEVEEEKEQELEEEEPSKTEEPDESEEPEEEEKKEEVEEKPKKEKAPEPKKIEADAPEEIDEELISIDDLEDMED